VFMVLKFAKHGGAFLFRCRTIRFILNNGMTAVIETRIDDPIRHKESLVS
jgi:hypothetical protein